MSETPMLILVVSPLMWTFGPFLPIDRLQEEYCGPFVKPPFLDIPFHMTGPTR